MPRREAIGYKVRRPMTLNGQKLDIGYVLTQDDIDSFARFDGVIASGKVVPIWGDKPDITGPFVTPVATKIPAPKKRTYKKRVKEEQ